MYSLILLYTCFSLTIANPLYAGTGCTLSTEYQTGDLKESQPLLLTTNLKGAEFIYPEGVNPVLKIHSGQSIYVACPGKYNYLENANQAKEARITCVRDKIFTIDGVPRNFSSITCKYMPEHDARRLQSPCLAQHRSVAIGFQLKSTFLQTIEVCRDDKTYTTYYTKFKLTQAIGNSQIRYPRPNKWLVSNYYPGMNIPELFKWENQVETLGKLLNSTELAQKRLRKSAQFLARGHLTAKADFVYGAQQRSTFWIINVAPQWQSFNGGNWKILEECVRNFASTRRMDLDVYTGVHGQMTMMDVNGNQQPIHLRDGRTRKALSVPKFYWKIIHDPLSRRATAFVGLNDPFIESIENDVYICKDISSKISWLTWNPKNIVAGVSYACAVDSLRKAIPTIPPLNATGILI